MTPDRVGRVEPLDVGDAVVDELVPVTRWWRYHGRCEWIERRGDKCRATPACIGTDRDELVMGPLFHEAGRSSKGAADRREPISEIALAPDEVAVRAQCVPTSEWHEGPGGRMTRPGNEPSVVVAAPAVGALAAGVAAVQLRPTGASCSVRWCVAHRAEPQLDHVIGKVIDRSVRLVGAHALSVDQGCDIGEPRLARQRGAAGARVGSGSWCRRALRACSPRWHRSTSSPPESSQWETCPRALPLESSHAR